MTIRTKLSVVLALCVLGISGQTPTSKSKLVVKTAGLVTKSNQGGKTILKITVRSNKGSATDKVSSIAKDQQPRDYTVDGDYQIITDGAIREDTVKGQHILTVYQPSAAELKAFGDCSGPCCLARNGGSTQCLKPTGCAPRTSCQHYKDSDNDYCSCN
jgi:hypothetical protein